jgi:hypothetical protein
MTGGRWSFQFRQYKRIGPASQTVALAMGEKLG